MASDLFPGMNTIFIYRNIFKTVISYQNTFGDIPLVKALLNPSSPTLLSKGNPHDHNNPIIYHIIHSYDNPDNPDNSTHLFLHRPSQRDCGPGP